MERIRDILIRLCSMAHHPVESFSIALRYATHAVRLYIETRTAPRKISWRVIPSRPVPLYLLWSIGRVLGATYTHSSSTLCIVWDDTTRTERPVPNAVNGACTDIRKSTVAAAFQKHFGYPLTIDPCTYTKPYVTKSETNAAHDGVIHSGTSKKNPSVTYQVLVDNRSDDEKYVIDLRTVIVGNTIPLVYKKIRPVARRFDSGSVRTTIEEPVDVFSKDEQQRILKTAQALGMDFGELDVIRDRITQKVYVVDANKTSISPPIHMLYHERKRAIERTAHAFADAFITKDMYH